MDIREVCCIWRVSDDNIAQGAEGVLDLQGTKEGIMSWYSSGYDGTYIIP